MAQLRRAQPDFTVAGVDIVTVGNGTVAEAATFHDDLDLPFAVLTDPDRTAYAAYHLAEGRLRDLLGPAVLLGYLRSTLRGHRLGKPAGNPRQLHGGFLIDRSGIIHFAKRPRTSSDLVTNEELLAAADW